MNMHGLKQLLVLALAGSGLACVCTAYGHKDGAVDTKATEAVCIYALGHLVNAGTSRVQEPAIMFSTTGVTEPLGVTVTFRVSGPLVGKINMGVHVN
ncbi:hypothetical protein Vi05172_g240 [Venturia inaequalis]|uniref:Uncharacterized protein n=1 Tax=Venturia inaequalis TaxID=5025 RepID=A0A8H3YQE3_VENIN|nr:hypothetical protein EG327_010551 [Venturia inaequalis]RDI89268.1 hypothetical protein Vi05172_g240 [Venturia inaequalis]